MANNPKKLLTPQQTADVLGVSLNAVWRLVRKGQLKVYRIGSALWIERPETE